MLWKDQIVVNDHKKINIEAVSVSPFTDSRRLKFSLSEDANLDLTFNLSGMAALRIESEQQEQSPESWLWEKGTEIIRRSAEADMLKAGEYLISEAELSKIGSLTLDQLPSADDLVQ